MTFYNYVSIKKVADLWKYYSEISCNTLPSSITKGLHNENGTSRTIKDLVTEFINPALEGFAIKFAKACSSDDEHKKRLTEYFLDEIKKPNEFEINLAGKIEIRKTLLPPDNFNVHYRVGEAKLTSKHYYIFKGFIQCLRPVLILSYLLRRIGVYACLYAEITVYFQIDTEFGLPNVLKSNFQAQNDLFTNLDIDFRMQYHR